MNRLLRPIALASLAILLSSASSQAGTIVGSIRASSPGAEETGGQSAYQSRRYKFLEKVDYSDLTDFVISIDGKEISPDPEKPAPTASVEQRDGAFHPRILPIVAGTEVSWPNRDDIYHNVFSMSEARPFDLGMYKSSDDPKRLVFEKPGQIDVFCAIHAQMNCVVLVLPNPWFALSDRRGRFTIENVPAGKHRLKAWHERLPSKYLEIDVPEEGEVEVDIVMGLAELPKF